MSSASPPLVPSHSREADSAAASAGSDVVEMLLHQQQQLTAVEQFSADHDLQPSPNGPAQETYYRRLMPTTPPADGQQYAFHVDLSACSGCKACVVACHSLNGLEEEESWRRVGTVTMGGSEARVQHVTTACHHCLDPGCLNGCPVAAYEKDSLTGIVRHLDDQCIGCKYCTMMCPYEVPRYSERLGIVRKCDMCHQRLANNEAPACVQSCPNEAISIRVVDSTGELPASTDRLSPGAPPSAITQPTTRFEAGHAGEFSAGTPQDHGVDEVAESHWPLAVMLVATQVSVGLVLAERIASSLLWAESQALPVAATRITTLAAFVVAAVGMLVAPLHLGQPLRAWRVFLGLRTSWLSREAVVLGKYVGALSLALLLLWLPTIWGAGDSTAPTSENTDSAAAWIPDWLAHAVLWGALVLGVAGLLSSAMIYIATRRQLWRVSRTMPRFLGTAVSIGSGSAAGLLAAAGAPTVIPAILLLVALMVAILKLDFEHRTHLGPMRRKDDRYERRSRRLATDELGGLSRQRMRIGIAAIAVLLFSLLLLVVYPGLAAITVLGLGVMGLAVGELLERLLYFRTVVYDRMPGTL